MTSSPHDASEPRLTIDLDALAANYATLRAAVGGAQVAPVVKADAYGLGAEPVAARLWAEGARTFFVARLSEGEALRAALAGRAADILVLEGCSRGTASALLAAGLVPVLNGLDQVENWTATAAGAPCALHIDTGMNRLGLRPEEARALKDAPGRMSRLNLTLILSHLACSSQPDHPMNATQLARFEAVCGLFPGLPSSLASSGGAFLGSAYARDMVRPGISLYGGGPFDRTDARILPVATLDAPILQIRTVRPGEGVGYGHSWIAQKPTRIGVIGAGYADGVLRSSAANGYGWLLGHMCPLIGRISMDLCAIDLSEVDDASPGHRVELFGAKLPLDQAAAQAGSIAYELLSRVAPRVRRIYQGKPE